MDGYLCDYRTGHPGTNEEMGEGYICIDMAFVVSGTGYINTIIIQGA
jgi:hypothetical protein